MKMLGNEEPTRENLLRSIRPGMKLDRAFFLKVYGYELTSPGFAETALQRLEALGCSRAQEYYKKIVSDYETQWKKELQEIGAWYLRRLESKWKGVKRRIGERKERYQFTGFPQDW